MVAAAMQPSRQKAYVASFAWERKRFDPSPGPRSAADFAGLDEKIAGIARVTPHSRLKVGRSFLPAVAAAAECELFLLDPRAGVLGLRRQIERVRRHLACNETVMVDVGGDILARGDEKGLRSPTADAMALAATAGTVCSRVVVVGAGLDGELSREEIDVAFSQARIAGATRRPPERLSPRVAHKIGPLLRWHPSEVSGLLCLALTGYNGLAEIRGDGAVVQVDGEATVTHHLDHEWTLRRSAIASAIAETKSFAEIDEVVRGLRGKSELNLERQTSKRVRSSVSSNLDDERWAVLEARLLAYSSDASRRRIRFLTLRRLAEVLDLSGRALELLGDRLIERHPRRFCPPVWLCQPQAALAASASGEA